MKELSERKLRAGEELRILPDYQHPTGDIHTQNKLPDTLTGTHYIGKDVTKIVRRSRPRKQVRVDEQLKNDYKEKIAKKLFEGHRHTIQSRFPVGSDTDHDKQARQNSNEIAKKKAKGKRISEDIDGNLEEKWVEYDFNFGEDKKEGMNIKRKYRKKFNLPMSLPGEIDATERKN